MTRVEGRGKPAQKLGNRTTRDQIEEPTKIRPDDPQTWVGLIWRVTEDPTRAVMLIALLAGTAVVLFVLLVLTEPVWSHAFVAGSASYGVLLVVGIVAPTGPTLPALRSTRPESSGTGPPDSPTTSGPLSGQTGTDAV